MTNKPPSFDLKPAEGGISLSAEVFGLILIALLSKASFLHLIDKGGLYRLKRVPGLCR